MTYKFKREARYVVVKLKDVYEAGIPKEDIDAFNKVCDAVIAHRARVGKPFLECVVIEADWPEYEIVWEMLQERVEAEMAGLDQGG